MRHRARLARHNSHCGITNKGKEMAFAPPTVEPRVIRSIVLVSDTKRMPQSVRGRWQLLIVLHAGKRPSPAINLDKSPTFVGAWCHLALCSFATEVDPNERGTKR